MLKDIRWCEGRTKEDGHWVGAWLDFWSLEAPRLVEFPEPDTNLAAWRNYAGAWRREKPSGGGKLLDDFFPRRVVNLPSSWEVTPDLGLEYAPATAYLDAFMTLHDERRQNDESNFAYLIDRYVGNGTHPTECLRSLLLGYLKTGEVVVGGKCFGCSVCVPDLGFERYPPSARQQVVVRLFAETVALIEQIEASNRATPATKLLEDLLDAILHEDAQGRSGTAYLDSWLARLIQDDPEHEGALWLRLSASGRGILSLSGQDLLAAITRLVRLVRTPEDMGYLGEMVEQYRRDSRYTAVQLPLTIQAAELAQRRQRWKDEAAAWREVVTQAEAGFMLAADSPLLRQALSRLVELHRPEGSLPDPAGVQDVALRLARLPETPPETAEMAYKLVVVDWRWRELEIELSSPKIHHAYAAVAAWLDVASPARHSALVEWLKGHRNQWSAWPVRSLCILEERLGASLNDAPETLLALAVALSQDTTANVPAARTLLRAWSAGANLSSAQLQQITGCLTQLDVTWFSGILTRRQQDEAALLDDLWKTTGASYAAAEWLLRLPLERMHPLPEDLAQAILRMLAASRTSSSKQLLSALVERLDPPPNSPILRTLVELTQQQPELATQFVQSRAADTQIERSTVALFFPMLLKDQSNAFRLKEALDSMASRDLLVQGHDLMALCLDNWRALRADTDVWPQLRWQHVESSTLVGIVGKWLSYADKPHRLDMLVIILRDVRQRSAHTWITPVSLEFQALCAGGRFVEAKRLLEDYPDMTVKGQAAHRHLDNVSKGVRERQGVFEQEFAWLWTLPK